MTPTVEFSYIVTIEPWPADGIALDLVATEAELRYLASRFDLADVTALKASGRIEQTSDGLVLSGALEADAVQTCVVTLKPVACAVNVTFQRRFRRRDEQGLEGDLDEIQLDGVEADIDVIESNEINIGEVIAEEFCLALDPYPRADDADRYMSEVQGTLDKEAEQNAENPFAKLRRH